MTDARFPERWLMDGRLQSAHPAAYRLFGNGLMWAVSNRSEGHIPDWALALIPHASEADAKELARTGLWLDDDRGGWTIDGYGDTQTSRADLELVDNARRAAAAKKRRQRHHAKGDHSLCYPDVCPHVPPDVPGTVPGDVPGVAHRLGKGKDKDRQGSVRKVSAGDVDPWAQDPGTPRPGRPSNPALAAARRPA